MKKTVKITDVARMAGVAKSTVSNVLTNKKFVSDELREKVMEACRALDFQPNFYASALSGRTSKIIALLLESGGDISRSFYKELIVACLVAASDRGYALLTFYNRDSGKLLGMLRQGSAPIDGAILMTPCVNDERLNRITSDRVNCVVIGKPHTDFELSYVDIDNVKLVSDVTQKLIGRYGKDIYLVNSDPALTISQERERSFCAVCDSCGIADAPARIFRSKKSSRQEGYALSQSVIKRGSVFVTANAELASGVYAAAAEQGLKIGKDVAVFALGKSFEREEFEPPLSRAEQDYAVLGAKAVEILIDGINSGNDDAKRCELVESKIIIKQSAEI